LALGLLVAATVAGTAQTASAEQSPVFRRTQSTTSSTTYSTVEVRPGGPNYGPYYVPPPRPYYRPAVAPFGFGARYTGTGLKDPKVNLQKDIENPMLNGFGLHFRNRTSRDWSWELSVDFLTASKTGDGTVTIGADSSAVAKPNDFKQTTVPIMLSGLYHILDNSRIDPYLLAGIGLQHTTLAFADSAFESRTWEFVGQLGGGLQVWLSRSFAIHADLRFLGVLQNLGSDTDLKSECKSSGYCAGSSLTPDPSEKFNIGYQFQLGGTFYWW